MTKSDNVPNKILVCVICGCALPWNWTLHYSCLLKGEAAEKTGYQSLFPSQKEGLDSIIPLVREGNDRDNASLINSVSKGKQQREVGIQPNLPPFN